MKIHMGTGTRFVEIECSDGYSSLGVLREFVIGLYDHLDDAPRVESMAVGFQGERRFDDELSRPDQEGSRGRRSVVGLGHR